MADQNKISHKNKNSSDEIKFTWFHHLANTVMRGVFQILLILDMQGLERTPKTGALIVAINHTNFMDPAMGSVFLRPDVLPMAKVELFKLPFSLIFNGYGAFPVRRGEGDLAALKHALKILKYGHVMLISPEGTRTKSGTLEAAHAGAALIAVKSGAPILPVAMWGGKKFWGNLFRLRRTAVGVRVGEPLMIAPLSGKPTREILDAITNEIMFYIAKLLPPEYRGRYSDVEHMQPRFVLPQHGTKAELIANPQKEVMPLTN